MKECSTQAKEMQTNKIGKDVKPDVIERAAAILKSVDPYKMDYEKSLKQLFAFLDKQLPTGGFCDDIINDETVEMQICEKRCCNHPCVIIKSLPVYDTPFTEVFNITQQLLLIVTDIKYGHFTAACSGVIDSEDGGSLEYPINLFLDVVVTPTGTFVDKDESERYPYKKFGVSLDKCFYCRVGNMKVYPR